METRTFHVDTNVFVQGLKRLLPQAVVGGGAATNPAGGIPNVTAPREVVQDNGLIFRYFTNAGVNISSNGAFAFLNNRSGDLLVRATKPDLEIVERTLELLNKIPPQAQIDAKFEPARQEPLRWAWAYFTLNPPPSCQ